MRSLFRVVATTCLPLLAVWVLMVAGVASTPALAQSDEAQDPPGQAVAPDEPQTDQPEEELSSKDRKQQAKERRIQEYLRKREERRAEKEMNQRAREGEQAEAEAREIEKEQLAAQEESEREAQRAATAAEPQGHQRPVLARSIIIDQTAPAPVASFRSWTLINHGVRYGHIPGHHWSRCGVAVGWTEPDNARHV